jgi:hypothetical protein
MPKEVFKQEVEKELTGRETEPMKIIYFKLYQSQLPVIERAIEKGGSDAGKRPISRLLFRNDLCGLPGRGSPGPRRPGDAAVFDDKVLQISTRAAATGISWKSQRESIMSPIGPKSTPLRLDSASFKSLRQQVLRRDSWRCQLCGTMSNLEVHHKQFRSHSRDDSKENLIAVCAACHDALHRE